jgi:hypothetical protein
MKSPRAALVATAIPLILASLPLTAGELPFNAPATERAKESAAVLHQTARALYDLPSATSNGQHISNLWLFPTADADTVFARYNLTSDEKVASGATARATEHLTVLTVRGNRIVESRELTSAHAELASNEPARPHWSAAIGTGTAAASTTTVADAKGPSPTAAQPAVTANTHWTSRIGTGRASDSTSPVMYASSANGG